MQYQICLLPLPLPTGLRHCTGSLKRSNAPVISPNTTGKCMLQKQHMWCSILTKWQHYAENHGADFSHPTTKAMRGSHGASAAPAVLCPRMQGSWPISAHGNTRSMFALGSWDHHVLQTSSPQRSVQDKAGGAELMPAPSSPHPKDSSIRPTSGNSIRNNPMDTTKAPKCWHSLWLSKKVLLGILSHNQYFCRLAFTFSSLHT